MNKCDAKTLLKTNNLKVTRQRLMILEEIINIDSIFTANSFHSKFKDHMDLVTIYRVLNILAEKNIIREIPNTEETKQYEIACIHNPEHPHFYCTICKKCFCLSPLKENDIKSMEGYAKNFSINKIGIQLSGLCPECK